MYEYMHAVMCAGMNVCITGEYCVWYCAYGKVAICDFTFKSASFGSESETETQPQLCTYNQDQVKSNHLAF